MPQGISAAQIGGLTWIKASGGGTITGGTGGTGFYNAPRTLSGAASSSTDLKLKITGGPTAGDGPVYTKAIVAPSGGYCVRKEGTNIWHIHNSYSIGVNTDFYLLPKDVSFSNVKFKEGATASSTSGWYDTTTLKGLAHRAWTSWFSISRGDSAKGCKVLFGSNFDYAWLKQLNPPPYSAGTFEWPIPWLYSGDLGTTSETICSMSQYCEVNAVGHASIVKGEATGENDHGDPDSNWPWNP